MNYKNNVPWLSCGDAHHGYWPRVTWRWPQCWLQYICMSPWGHVHFLPHCEVTGGYTTSFGWCSMSRMMWVSYDRGFKSQYVVCYLPGFSASINQPGSLSKNKLFVCFKPLKLKGWLLLTRRLWGCIFLLRWEADAPQRRLALGTAWSQDTASSRCRRSREDSRWKDEHRGLEGGVSGSLQ